MKSREIAERRMYSQHLWGTPFDTPEEVVGWLGAVQAQEFHYAKWSVAQRADGVDDAAMDRAFADGTFLRTHILRPTWHFVLAEDLRWMLSLSAPRIHALNAHLYRKLELDVKTLARADSLLAMSLKDGAQLTRKEIATVMAKASIDTSDQRLAFILMHAELDSVVCSGALRGKQHTYALFDDRVPSAKALDRDEALARLTSRYFTARGPATLKDFSRWSSLTMADCRGGLGSVGSELDHEVVEGRTYWFASIASSPEAPSKRIDLVQGYDECIMSYSESRDALFSHLESPIVPGSNATPYHAVLLGGRLIGHWRRALSKGSAEIETWFYRPLKGAEERSFEDAVARFGRYLGVPTTMI
jgi:hypothetical protein